MKPAIFQFVIRGEEDVIPFHETGTIVTLCKNFLVHRFVCAAGAGKSFRLGLEGKAHSENIAHSFP